MEKISGSFRDPSATVFTLGDRIIRGINKSGEEKFRLLTESKILEKSIEKNAPKGLIEFVPKEDETIKIMLRFRKDIFEEYTEDNFKKILLKKAKIIKINNIENSLRKIYEYEKTS